MAQKKSYNQTSDDLLVEDDDHQDLSASDVDDDDIDDEEFEKELQVLARSKSTSNKIFVNNEEGLKHALDELKLKLPWEELFTVTADTNCAVNDIHDDLERETAFYQQTLQVVKTAQSKLDKISIPHKRPTDYFAEMLKSDEHMLRVRSALLNEKKRIESFEEKRKQKEQKKYGKQLQVQQKQQKDKVQKEHMKTIKQWRKARQKGEADEEFPIELEETDSGKVSNSLPNVGKKRYFGQSNQSITNQKRQKINIKKNGKRPGKSARQKSKNPQHKH